MVCVFVFKVFVHACVSVWIISVDLSSEYLRLFLLVSSTDEPI